MNQKDLYIFLIQLFDSHFILFISLILSMRKAYDMHGKNNHFSEIYQTNALFSSKKALPLTGFRSLVAVPNNRQSHGKQQEKQRNAARKAMECRPESTAPHQQIILICTVN